MLWRKRQGVEDESCKPAKKKKRANTNKSSAKPQSRGSLKSKKAKAAPWDKYAVVKTSQESPSLEPCSVGVERGSFSEMCKLFESDLGLNAEEAETPFFDASKAAVAVPSETPSRPHPSSASSLNVSNSSSYNKLRHRATLDVPDEDILQLWNAPVRRRSSVVLGFGMTNGQYCSGHMPDNVQSCPADVTSSMFIQSQQSVSMDNILTQKTLDSVEQKKVGLGSVKKCSVRARAA